MRVLFALLLLVGRVFAAEAANPIPQRGSFRTTLTRTVGYDYLLSLPAAYGSQTERSWPTILFLHSVGEAGSDLALLSNHGPLKVMAASQPENQPPPPWRRLLTCWRPGSSFWPPNVPRPGLGTRRR